MTANCGCNTSCPEPCAVTINVTSVTWNGDDASFQVARFSKAAGTVTADSATLYRIITLPSNVAAPESVQLFRNSGAQRNGLDFVVSGNQIFLAAAAGDSDEFLVHWFSSDATATVGGYSVGHLAGFASDPGTGWLAMDGSTSINYDDYAALGAYLAVNTSLLLSGSAVPGGSFVLKNVTFPFYDGSSLQTLQGYIHV